MISKCMVSLVGEQPAPNFLPARHVRPDELWLVHTSRTAQIAQRLAATLEPGLSCALLEVPAHDLVGVTSELTAWLRGMGDRDLVVNITGGTKIMALAMVEVARRYGFPFVYLQSEDNRSRLFTYRFLEGEVRLLNVEDLVETITLHDYMHLHLGGYTCGPTKDDLEVQVADVLSSDTRIDELMMNLLPERAKNVEIDLVVRCGNNVGIGEIKCKAKKRSIDQLNSVCSREHAGTYTRKFLVTSTPLDGNNAELTKAYGVNVIELPSYRDSGTLSAADRERLVATIAQKLR